MKRLLILIISFIFLINITGRLNSIEENPPKILKRTIAILPFSNLKKDKNDFYSILLRNALKARMLEKNLYNLIEFGDINKNIEKYSLIIDELNRDELKAGNFAKSLKADIVIYGLFAVQKDQITISITAYDIIFKKTIVSVSENCDTGLAIFDMINIKIGQNFTDMMSKDVTMIDETIFKELEEKNKYKIEEMNMDVIQELLKENEKYIQVDINVKGEIFPLAIPRGYNVIIFVKNDPGIFQIKYNDQIYETSVTGIKILVFENQIGVKREFSLIKNEKETINYNYVQKKDSEIIIKNVKFIKDNIKFTLLRNEKKYQTTALIFTAFSGIMLLSGGFTVGFMGYYMNLYYTTPIELPEKILEYKDDVYSLFTATIILSSVTIVFLIPSVVFWAIYGYCQYFRKNELKKYNYGLSINERYLEFYFKLNLII